MVAAADADGDGYGSAACKAAATAGADCNDAQASIHPGAAEVCDGIDNNCNGLADLNDGLALSGTPLPQSGYSGIQLAWAPTLQRFAMVASWGSDYDRGLYFGSLSTAGSAAWNTTSMWNTDFLVLDMLWVPTAERFVCTYTWGNKGGSGSELLLITDQGVMNEEGDRIGPDEPNNYVGGPSMALRTAGDAVVAGTDRSNIYFSRYNGFGLGVNATITGEVTFGTRIAASGDLSAIIYQIASTNTVNWVRINASLVPGSLAQLTSNGQNPDITGLANGYAMVWQTTAGFDYQVMSSADGSVVCITHVPFGNGTPDEYDAVVIRATQYGVLALAADYGGKQLHLFRFDSACTVVDDVTVRNSSTSFGAPAIAVGGGSVALVWPEFDGNRGVETLRMMGERLCN